ncbi:SAM-dependent chlorinase/fluorinase [bacterium]|nr:SAM-dependent chlorinase/fluorinase [candidate division CSSED10-310 bacterium]
MFKPVISLTTDFGYNDPYVGIMKGVILDINRDCHLVDLCHGISSFNIEEAAFVLSYSYRYLPKRTVHLVVVDPGVGGSRRPILASLNDHLFVCPDNGVLSYIISANPNGILWEIEGDHYFLKPVSSTFHGRDVFAPVAAWLSKHLDPPMFGEEISDYMLLPARPPEVSSAQIKGRVLHVDGFGNLITNIAASLLNKHIPKEMHNRLRIRIGERIVHGLSAFYQQSPDREPVALIGSSGYLEIALPGGSAARQLAMGFGDQVLIAS